MILFIVVVALCLLAKVFQWKLRTLLVLVVVAILFEAAVPAMVHSYEQAVAINQKSSTCIAELISQGVERRDIFVDYKTGECL